MPILTRRKPDHFFYFHRRCKAYPVRGYQKDIRRDKMTGSFAAASVKRPTPDQFFW